MADDGVMQSSRASSSPRLLSAIEDADELRALRRSASVFDTIRMQLGELVETRAPARKIASAEVGATVDALLGSEADAYGKWAFFPWSNRLVHVLPEDEYRELRTSRNRNKITQAEQVALARVTIGVAGLSVGQATAVTLALEGVGGTMRLADFDELNLSNMNRLRAGVHEIGVNKAIVTARTIFEMNPYACIEIFDDGVTDENIDRFLSSLDLLFEECDDLKMKVRLREKARERRIPVLMETSDRGMFDVERFDREPGRALFHGLTGELRADALAGLTTYQKVPVVLDIIGATTMSSRMAASLVDIEATLKTWPQLASAVALGGAINTDAARRIVLGEFTRSGRFFVDLEQLVGDPPAEAPEPARVPLARTRTTDAVARSGALDGPLDRAQLEQIVRWGALAPSGGNCQPWRFVYRQALGALECIHEPSRSETFLDFEHRASYAAFGAVAENVRLACLTLGIGVQIDAFPDGDARELAFVARFRATTESTASAEDRSLANWVTQRVTNRRLGVRVPLQEDVARLLVDAVATQRSRLQLLFDPQSLDRFGELHGETERLRLLHPVMHREMMSEIRWSTSDAEATCDGLDIATLELTPTDRAGISVLRSPAVSRTLRSTHGGQGLQQASRKAIAASSAVGVVTTSGTSPRDYFRGGRAMQRLWLTANAHGLAFQPMTAMLYVFARMDGGGSGLDERDRSEFARARAEYLRLFAVNGGEAEVLAFRLGVAGPPTARSLRRPLAEILELRD
jgi:nitroreductase